MDPVVVTCPQPCATELPDIPVSMIRDPPTGITSLYSVAALAPASESAHGVPSGLVNLNENGAGAFPVFTRIIVVCQPPPSAIWEIAPVSPARGDVSIT